MPVKGCGVDAIEIARIARAIKRPGFQGRVFTEYERDYLSSRPVQSWAARFAAKEAVMKSLGRGWLQGVSFAEIEIRADEWGRPSVTLVGGAREVARQQGVTRFVVSLTHTKELAIAYVIALGEEEHAGSDW
ncbi:MAG: holo-ACP synthase [Limnochordia bacterium]|mgnify:FL=1|jgi:holo-[acyl-carrier protein] synthase